LEFSRRFDGQFGRRFGPQKCIQGWRPRAGTVRCVDFVANRARRLRGRVRDGYQRIALWFLLDQGNFVRRAWLRLRRALGFDCRVIGCRIFGRRNLDSRSRRTAAARALARRDDIGARAAGDRTLNRISLNASQIFHAIAPAVPDRAGEVLVAPLNFQLCSDRKGSLDPDTCPADRCVFHTRADSLQSPIGVLPRRLHLDQHGLPDVGYYARLELGQNGAHAITYRQEVVLPQHRIGVPFRVFLGTLSDA